jgi:hypothetical protein
MGRLSAAAPKSLNSLGRRSQTLLWQRTGDLLSKSEVLQSKMPAGPKKDSEGAKQSEDEVDHETTVTPFNMPTGT